MRFRFRQLACVLLVCAAALVAQDWRAATTLPAVDLTGLSTVKTATALRLLRDNDCTCGCGMKLAECRVKDPGCAYSKSIAAAMVDALKAGKTEAAALAAAKSSKFGAAPAPPKLLGDPKVIATAGSPFAGPKDAPVTLIEFSDFQCPYCYKAADQLREVLKAFPTQVKLVFRQFPLETHSQAALAAAAAIAAHRQGKFWPLHDLMFANRQDLSRDAITKMAVKVGLDMKRFDADWPSKETLNAVMRDMQDGEKAGVEGTPTVFINGKKYGGSLELTPMRNVILAELKPAGKK
jgi:protein-disulfide isomerase